MIAQEQWEWFRCKRCRQWFLVRVTYGTNGNVLDEGQPDECEECHDIREAEDDNET